MQMSYICVRGLGFTRTCRAKHQLIAQSLIQSVSKRALQLYSKLCCVASVRKRLHLKAYKESIFYGVEYPMSKEPYTLCMGLRN
jgi:hypothetical protein